MTGSDAFTTGERQQAKARWISYAKGSPHAVKPPSDNSDDILLSAYKAKLEEDKSMLKRDKRYAYHFRLSVYRDTRYSLAGSQYCLRLAIHNQVRTQGEVSRLHTPLAMTLPPAEHPSSI